MITGNEPYHMATSESGHVGQVPGITIRQHFAAMAMQGLSAHPSTPNYDAALVADYSVQYADALIAALNNSNTKE